MASQAFLVHIDLGQNQLQYGVIHPLPTASEPTGVVGQVYYNTTISRLKVHNGTTWTNVGSVDSVTLIQPSNGFTVTPNNSPQTGAASFQFALSDDLAALEGISTTGFSVRTGASTWATRSITGNAASGVNVIYSDGVGGNPQINIDDTIIATKAYVDSLLQGVKWRNSVKVMTTSSLPVLGSGSEITNPVVDGVTITVGERVLVNIAPSDATNGVWMFHQDGPTHWSWFRATDLDTWNELVSSVVMVEEGTYADTSYVCTINSNAGTLGSTAVTWVKMSKAIGTIDLTTSVTGVLPIANGGTGFSSYSAGDLVYGSTSGGGLSKLTAGAAGTVLTSGGVGAAPSWATPASVGIVSKYSTNCIAATSQTITHNLNTTDIIVQVREHPSYSGSLKRQVFAETRVIDANSFTLLFNVAPAAGQYRIIVMG